MVITFLAFTDHVLQEYLQRCVQEKRGLLAAKDDIIRLLKQASCFGNHDATFMLSVILNYGLDIKSNEQQVVLKVIKYECVV